MAFAYKKWQAPVQPINPQRMAKDVLCVFWSLSVYFV